MRDVPTKAIRANGPSYDEVVAAMLEARERCARVETLMQFRAWKAAAAIAKVDANMARIDRRIASATSKSKPSESLPAVGSFW